MKSNALDGMVKPINAKYILKSFTIGIILHMQMHLIYGVQSVPNMELEEFRLPSSFAKFKLSNFLIINYFLWLGFWHCANFCKCLSLA